MENGFQQSQPEKYFTPGPLIHAIEAVSANKFAAGGGGNMLTSIVRARHIRGDIRFDPRKPVLQNTLTFVAAP